MAFQACYTDPCRDTIFCEMSMCNNIGVIGRSVRIVAGIGILGAGVMYGSWWGLVGIVPLLAGIAGICPIYCPFEKGSCSVACTTKDVSKEGAVETTSSDDVPKA